METMETMETKQITLKTSTEEAILIETSLNITAQLIKFCKEEGKGFAHFGVMGLLLNALAENADIEKLAKEVRREILLQGLSDLS